MDTLTAAILFLIAASVLGSVLFGGRLPRPYRRRGCQGKGWRDAFPDSPSRDVREFLSVFVDSFAFSRKERLKLNPEDQIVRIYRSVYPNMWMPDSLELETLANGIESRYGFSLEKVWHENITLGELFRTAREVRGR